MSFLFEKAKGSIQVFALNNKTRILTVARNGVVVLCTVCVAVLSYGAVKIGQNREVRCPVSVYPRSPVSASQDAPGTDADVFIKVSPEGVLGALKGSENSDPLSGAGGRVVASKSGSRYHYPWCAGASQIKEENKIWYASEDVAQQAGLTKAKNCQ